MEVGHIVCVRWYDRAEPRPLHLQFRLYLLAGSNDFRPDMLSLTITISPDHQKVCRPSLCLKITFDRAKVLLIRQGPLVDEGGERTLVTKVWTGASKRAKGSHDDHLR